MEVTQRPIPYDPPVLPPEDPAATRNAPADPGTDGKLRAATYNIAGAANGHHDLEAITDTARTLAGQVVGGETDVVALQEVDVGTGRATDNLPEGFTDHNEFVLAHVAAKEQGLQEPVTFRRSEAIDGDGRPVTVITGVDGSGRYSRVVISKEYIAQDGAPTLPGLAGLLTLRPAVTTVYNADVLTPDGVQDYTMVFGGSRSVDGGSFGNAVLLGPRATLQRDADGNPQVALRDLGANDPTDDENRTALEVGIDVAGREATVFSAHLTYDDDKDPEGSAEARADQYDTLATLAEASGDNTLLLGDFNDDSRVTVGPLTGGNFGENYVSPTAQDLSDWFAEGKTNIDRIYVSADVDATNRIEYVKLGGSDHELVAWDVDLDA